MSPSATFLGIAPICRTIGAWSPWRHCAQRREDILRLAEGRGAHDLRVFGSVARGEAGEDSDLDLLVAWEPGGA
jgi:predicted nucleotidyltransferase